LFVLIASIAVSAHNQSRFHLPDGPDQRARDEEMASGSTAWAFNTTAWIYGYDAAAIDEVPAVP
jgi:salicylate hydroxylase